MIAMGRNAGFAAAVNRGIRESTRRVDRGAQQRRRTGARLFRRALLPQAHALVRHRQNPACRGPAAASMARSTSFAAAALRGASAAAAPTGRAFAVPRRICLAALDGGPVSRRAIPPSGPARRGLRIVSGRRGFRPALRRRGLRPAASARGRGLAPAARRWAAGIRKRCGRIARNQVFLLARHYPDRAAGGAGCGPSWWRRSLWGAVALRHGAARAWLRGQSARAFARVLRAAYEQDYVGAGSTGTHAYRDQRTQISPSPASSGRRLYWQLYFFSPVVGQSDTCRPSESSSSPIIRGLRSAPAWMPRWHRRRGRGGGQRLARRHHRGGRAPRGAADRESVRIAASPPRSIKALRY